MNYEPYFYFITSESAQGTKNTFSRNMCENKFGSVCIRNGVSRSENKGSARKLHHNIKIDGGPGSVVGVATSYGLDGRGIESRWGARFSAPVQTGPGAHSASCTMGTGSFLGVKSGRGVTLTPHPLLMPWS